MKTHAAQRIASCDASVATRIGVSVLFVVALALGIGLPTAHVLPTLALGNREILWGERTLIFFYGFLLLFVPLARGLQGQLPIELSTRGARWQETTVESERVTGALNRRVDDLIRELERTGGALPELTGHLVDLEALVSPRPRSASRRRRG